MTDAELIARLRDAPADGLGTENLCLEAADRIEQLKHRLFQCATDLQIYMDAFAVSEAKLAAAIKLAELIRRCAGMGMNPSTDLQHMASDLLAILKGDTP